MHQITLPDVLPFTTIAEGIAALTGKYQMMYINNKDHKSEDGKTIIRTTQKQNQLCKQPNQPSHKKYFLKQRWLRKYFTNTHLKNILINLIQDVLS